MAAGDIFRRDEVGGAEQAAVVEVLTKSGKTAYAPAAAVSGSGGGGLTNAELRAEPVPVVAAALGAAADGAWNGTGAAAVIGILKGIFSGIANLAPARNALAVTPSDSVNLTNQTRALYVGSAGNVSVNIAGSGGVTFVGVPAGTRLDVVATRVNAAGTTAGNIVALW